MISDQFSVILLCLKFVERFKICNVNYRLKDRKEILLVCECKKRGKMTFENLWRFIDKNLYEIEPSKIKPQLFYLV